jgi:hypothetical protein
MSDIPFGQEAWESIASMVESADKDPDGFNAYRDLIDQANIDNYPNGDGEV